LCRAHRQGVKRYMNDEEIELRRKTILELKGKPSAVAVPLLLQAVEDTSWRIRKTATGMLVEEHPLEHYVGGLIRLLHRQENAGARNAAIETLVILGKNVTPFLVEAFDTPDRDARKFIVDIVGEVKDRKALPLLLKALKDEDDNVRASAVEHLGRMGDSTVVDALIEILREGDIWTAFPAADALGRIGDKKAIPALINALSVKALREPALKGLGHLSAPETVEQVVPFLMDRSKTIQEEALKTVGIFYHNRVPADLLCEALKRLCGPDIISRLISHSRSPKTDVRSTAILVLGLMQDERALGPLLELCTDESLVEDVKRALIFIGKSRPESLIPFFGLDNPHDRRFITEVAVSVASPVYYPIFENLLDDRDGHVRAAAAIGLSKIPDKRAAESIKKLLSDPYVDVQEAVVEALGNLGNMIDVHEYIGYLKDKNPALRRNAALLLGKIAASESVSALAFALKDEDVSVREAVVGALSSLKTDESIRCLVFALTDENPRIRTSAALSLGSLGAEEGLEPLVLLLGDSDDEVRVAAIRALGMMGDRRALPHLITMLDDRNGFIVTTALESLSRLKGEDARGALIRMVTSDDIEIRRTAIRSLSSFEGIEDIILPYLRDPDWATRVAVVEVLGQGGTGRARAELEKLYDREEDPAVRKAIEEHIGVR
jgi:HEAT repeat protein